MGLNFQVTPRPVHQQALPVVLLQGSEHAGQHRVQAGLLFLLTEGINANPVAETGLKWQKLAWHYL